MNCRSEEQKNLSLSSYSMEARIDDSPVNKNSFFQFDPSNIINSHRTFNTSQLAGQSKVAIQLMPTNLENATESLKRGTGSMFKWADPPSRFLSQSFKKGQFINSDFGSIPSIQKARNTLVSSQSASKKLSNSLESSNIFVYKIIHDLRHPAQALSDGLTKLIQEASSFRHSQEQNSQTQTSAVISKKQLKYQGTQRVQKTIQQLKTFIRKTKGVNKKSSIAMRRRNHSQSDIKRVKLGIENSMGFVVPRVIKTNQQKDEDLPSKSSSEAKSPWKSASSIRSPLAVKVANKNLGVADQNLKSDLKILQNSFWSLPLENLDHRQAELVPIQALANPEVIEEEKVEKMLVKDGELIEQIRSKSNSHQSSNSEIQIDDGISEFSKDHEQISFIETKKPQKKSFSRSNLEVVKIIQQNKHKSKSDYIFNSLAVDRILFTSEVARRLKVISYDQLQPHLSIKSSKVRAFSNVMKVMDLILSNQKQSLKSGKVSLLKQAPDKIIKPQPEFLQKNLSDDCESQQSQSECKFLMSSKEEVSYQAKKKEKDSGESDKFRNQCISIESENSFESNLTLNNSKLSKLIEVLIDERRFMVSLIESHMKKRIGIKKQCETLQGQVQMMLSLMTDLMNQAQMRNNTFTMANDYFDCKKLINQCFKTLMVQSRIKNVTLLGPIFDQPLERFYFRRIFGDERRYRQIILNFLSNAIKFTPRDGVVSVHLRVIEVSDMQGQDIENIKSDQSQMSAPDKEVIDSQDQDPPAFMYKMIKLHMIFRDSGCGISKENQQKLFMNFGKLQDNQGANKQGVGLGLSICKEIIHAYGGSIDIISEEGKGTDFIIEILTSSKLDWGEFTRANQKLQDGGYLSPFTSQSESLDNSSQNTNQLESGLLRCSLTEVSETAYEESLSASKSFKESNGDSKGKSQKGKNKRGTSKRSKTEFLSEEKDRKIKMITNRKRLTTINEIDSRPDQYMSAVLSHQVTHCLIANDDPFMLQASFDILSQHFDVVDQAQDGFEALQMVRRRPTTYYSAIILDIQMPVMDGIDACRAIRQFFNQDNQEEEKKGKRCDDKFYESGRSASSSVKNNTLTNQKHPLLYALTAESRETEHQRMRAVGFEDVFSNLSPPNLMQILEKAGLQYVVRRESEDVRIDISQQYLSSSSLENSCIDYASPISIKSKAESQNGLNGTFFPKPRIKP